MISINDEDYEEEVRIACYEEITDLVTNYARLHHKRLHEATTILELALWKAVILSRDDNQELPHVECKTDAGHCSEVVIKLVLTFL
jgi:hypothetical protein